MQDTSPLSAEQQTISTSVNDQYVECQATIITHHVSPHQVGKCISKLKRNSSPGVDGITAEFFIYGISDVLCQHLSALYSAILMYNCIPNVFSTGVIIPMLKKPTLDPSVPSNYRPITISTVFSKLFEVIIVPEDVPLCSNQFGFRPNYGVSHGLTLINDLICYNNHNKSNMCLCSLDAEKCFDSIWHDGLFYKLKCVLPLVHWRILYNWYKCLDVVTSPP